MKFEEVLPKMRDEGRIANLNGHLHKFADGRLWMKCLSGRWEVIQYTGDGLTTDDWKLEPVKVSKWRWVFGFGSELQMTAYGYLSESEACMRPSTADVTITRARSWSMAITSAIAYRKVTDFSITSPIASAGCLLRLPEPPGVSEPRS